MSLPPRFSNRVSMCSTTEQPGVHGRIHVRTRTSARISGRKTTSGPAARRIRLSEGASHQECTGRQVCGRGGQSLNEIGWVASGVTSISA